MEVTTKDTKKSYKITLRTWDGWQWLPDCAHDVLDTWANNQVTQADINWLVEDCERFNGGQDLDWLVHCSNTQEVWLDVEEVQADA